MRLIIWLLRKVVGETETKKLTQAQLIVLYRDLHGLSLFKSLLDNHIDWAKEHTTFSTDTRSLDFYRGYLYHAAMLKERTDKYYELWVKMQEKEKEKNK